MIKTQDLYTTLLGAKGQVESDSSTVEKLCRTCNTILGGLDADKIDEISKELSSCSEKVKNLVQKYEDLSLLKNNVETINSNLVDPLKKFLDNMAMKPASTIMSILFSARTASSRASKSARFSPFARRQVAEGMPAFLARSRA